MYHYETELYFLTFPRPAVVGNSAEQTVTNKRMEGLSSSTDARALLTFYTTGDDTDALDGVTKSCPFLLGKEALDVLSDELRDLLLQLLWHGSLGDVCKDLAAVRCEVVPEGELPSGDLVNGNAVEQTSDTCEDDGDLDLRGEGSILSLLQELRETTSTVEC